MNLNKKKLLAARTLKVGIERIFFVPSRLGEIKEAMTKQDIRDLHKEEIILIKPVKGRKKSTQRKSKKGQGNKRKNIRKKKRNYLLITRKLRRHLRELRSKGEVSGERIKEMRKKIRARDYKSKAHMISQIKGEEDENRKKSKKQK